MTKNLTDLLAQALRTTPQSMQEVRYHLRRALTIAEKHDQKKKETAHPPTWFNLLKGQVQNPLTPQRTLDIINQMLEAEKMKLTDSQDAAPDQQLTD